MICPLCGVLMICPLCGMDCKKMLAENQVDLNPEFSAAVDKNFWELTEPEKSASSDPPETRPEKE